MGYFEAQAAAQGAGMPDPRTYWLDPEADWRCEEAYEAKYLNRKLKAAKRKDVGVSLIEHLSVYGEPGVPTQSPPEPPRFNKRKPHPVTVRPRVVGVRPLVTGGYQVDYGQGYGPVYFIR